jgi:hypothetical protein
MKPTARFFTALSFCIAIAARPPQAFAADVSVQEYRQQVSDLRTRVDSLKTHPEQAGELLNSIPDEQTVRAGKDDIAVSYRTLKNELTAFSADAEHKPDRLDRISNYLQTLESEADNYAHPETLDPERSKLDAILSAHEFQKVHAPGLRERLLSRLYRSLGRFLMRLMLSGNAHFSLVQALVYVLLAIAVVVVIIWTVRRFRRSEEEIAAREIIPFAPSARSWRAWLVEAREFAAESDWRNAIHMAYWAGISFLEAGGAWKPDRARTPREYLRLISSRDPQFPPLSTLTRKFEVVWYGDHPARQADFEETLQHLERLGCR